LVVIKFNLISFSVSSIVW